MILSLAILLLPLVLGICLISSLSIFQEKTVTIATGSFLGLALSITFTYLATAFFLLKPPLLLAIVLIHLVAIYFLCLKKRAWRNFRELPLDKTALITLVVLLILFGLITPKLLSYDSGGLRTQVINAYGDLGFHMANITNLAYGPTLPPASPILSNHKLTYPFFTNFYSAMLLAAGSNYSQSVIWPAFLLIPLSLILLHQLTYQLTHGKKAALLVLLLFTLGGGTFGWLRLTTDLTIPHSSLTELLANLPRNYTGHSDDPDGFHIINPVVSMLLPQRSFMFGMGMAFMILLLLTIKNSAIRRRSYILAGILAGLLPLFHAHTVLALIPIILLLVIINPHRHWQLFFTITLLVGLPGIIYYLSSGASSSAAPHLQLGWMSQENIFLFWLKNTGFLIPITLLGLFRPAPKILKPLALAGLSLFTAANIWLFAAWEWDNTKIFVYWILFTLPLAAFTTIDLWHKSKYYFRGVILAFVIFHLITGSIDVLRLTLPNLPAWEEWNASSIALAKYIRTHTSPSDTILIAPYHNSPAALSGRSVYLGFAGHVWTHGGDHWEREAAIGNYFSGALATLPQHQPQYVIVGPVEYTYYPDLSIRPEWQFVTRQGDYELYKL